MFIQKLKKAFEPGYPIFIEDILSLFSEYSRAYVFRLLKQCELKGDIIRFARGVYCLPSKTLFKGIGLSSSAIAENKYITNGSSVYGVYSGLMLLNQFSISSQIPNTLEIVTNYESTRKRVVDINGIKFIIRKSRFEITKENYNYYTILQLFLELGFNPQLDEFSKKQITQYIKENNLKQNQLIHLALKFPSQVLKNLFSSEVLNGTL